LKQKPLAWLTAKNLNSKNILGDFLVTSTQWWWRTEVFHSCLAQQNLHKIESWAQCVWSAKMSEFFSPRNRPSSWVNKPTQWNRPRIIPGTDSRSRPLSLGYPLDSGFWKSNSQTGRQNWMLAYGSLKPLISLSTIKGQSESCVLMTIKGCTLSVLLDRTSPYGSSPANCKSLFSIWQNDRKTSSHSGTAHLSLTRPSIETQLQDGTEPIGRRTLPYQGAHNSWEGSCSFQRPATYS